MFITTKYDLFGAIVYCLIETHLAIAKYNRFWAQNDGFEFYAEQKPLDFENPNANLLKYANENDWEIEFIISMFVKHIVRASNQATIECDVYNMNGGAMMITWDYYIMCLFMWMLMWLWVLFCKRIG